MAGKNSMTHIRALLRGMIGLTALVFIVLSIFADKPNNYLTIGLTLNVIFLLGGIGKRKLTRSINMVD